MDEPMSAKNTIPTNGPARALWKADPATPVSEIPELLQSVERWRCRQCGNQRFTRPEHCGGCGERNFEKVQPEESND